jgi:hypothetical protein
MIDERVLLGMLLSGIYTAAVLFFILLTSKLPFHQIRTGSREWRERAAGDQSVHLVGGYDIIEQTLNYIYRQYEAQQRTTRKGVIEYRYVPLP